jgi:hypothetical protein
MFSAINPTNQLNYLRQNAIILIKRKGINTQWYLMVIPIPWWIFAIVSIQLTVYLLDLPFIHLAEAFIQSN